MHQQDEITPLVNLIDNLVEQNTKLKRGLLALETVASRSVRTHPEREEARSQMADLYAEISATAVDIADILQSLNELSATALMAIPQNTQNAISLAEQTMRLGLDQIKKPTMDTDRPVAAIIPFRPK